MHNTVGIRIKTFDIQMVQSCLINQWSSIQAMAWILDKKSIIQVIIHLTYQSLNLTFVSIRLFFIIIIRVSCYDQLA